MARDEGGPALVDAYNYIVRMRECDVRDRSPIIDAASYIGRQNDLDAARREVVGYKFFCRGDWTEHQVWSGIDQAARTKKGRYHRRAGGRPRLAILAEFSLPWDLSETDKVRLSHELAQRIVDEYGAAVAVACHRKQDAPDRGVDHCHLLITMREVDETGIGAMIRRFNGIASSMSDDRVIVGKRALSGHVVWMRKTWADLLGDATGVDYDWRSYKDQGLDLEPVKALSRSAIEGDRRQGGALMAERAATLAARNAAFLHRAEARESRQRERPQASSLAAALIGTDARLTPFGSFNPIALLAIASSAGDTVTEGDVQIVQAPVPVQAVARRSARNGRHDAATGAEGLAKTLLRADACLSRLDTFSPIALLAIASFSRVDRVDERIDTVAVTRRSRVSRREAPEPEKGLATTLRDADTRVSALGAFSPLAIVSIASIFDARPTRDLQDRPMPDVVLALAEERGQAASVPQTSVKAHVPSAVPLSEVRPPTTLARGDIGASDADAYRPVQVEADGRPDVAVRTPAIPIVKSPPAPFVSQPSGATDPNRSGTHSAHVAGPKSATNKPAPIFFTILDEGGAESGASFKERKDLPSTQRPDSGPAIAFGAAMIASGWRTRRGEAALADAIGWELGAFAAATARKAIEIKNQGLSPTIVRLEARDSAEGPLRHLFDELESERRDAKRKKAKISQNTIDIEAIFVEIAVSKEIAHAPSRADPTLSRLEPVGGARDHHASTKAPATEHLAQSAAHGSSSAEASLSHQDQIDDDRVSKSNLNETGHQRGVAQKAKRSPYASDIPSHRALNDDGEADIQCEQPSPSKPSRTRQSRPEIIDIILDLAALLAWRGKLGQHLETICTMCGLSRERIGAETGLRLQAFAQIKNFMNDGLQRILTKAKAIGNADIDVLIDVITLNSRGGKSKPSHRQDLSREKDRDIKR